MDRAFAKLSIKSVDEERREIRGVASTVSADRMGDIVDPRGAQYELPMPLLWQHDANQPVGHVTAAKTSDERIEITARVEKSDEPGRLKDRLDEAWQTVKLGLVRGLSIGFRGLEVEPLKTGGLNFKTWDWLELSMVTIPANAEANIQTIKSVCQYIPAQQINGGYKLAPIKHHPRLNPDGSYRLRDCSSERGGSR